MASLCLFYHLSTLALSSYIFLKNFEHFVHPVRVDGLTTAIIALEGGLEEVNV
jgi:hypothetical protein